METISFPAKPPAEHFAIGAVAAVGFNHRGRVAESNNDLCVALLAIASHDLRQPLQVPASTNGGGSAKVWQPCTPAMAAGLTDHIWSLREVLMFRVPPWPQPQRV